MTSPGGQAAKLLKKPPTFPWMDLSGDFAKVGEGLGAQVQRVTRPGELREAIERALAAKGPVVLDVETLSSSPEP